MGRLIIRAVLVPCLLAAFATGPVQATTIRLHSLETLTGVAERVTHGSVVEARVERDDRGEIWTVYTLLVREELKEGSLQPGASFEVRQFGGTLGGETALAVGFPQFRIGEEVLLFLQPGDSGHRILNAWQGAVRIVETPSLSGGPALKLVPSVAGLFPESHATDLAAFKVVVRAAVEGAAP